MSSVHVSIDIDAPPERVWALITDLGRLSEWVTIHRAVGRTDDGPLRPGFTMQQTFVLRGQDFTVDWTAARVEEPTALRWEGTGPAGSQAVSEYHLESSGDTTRFTYVNQFAPPGGVVGKVASRVVVGDTTQQEAAASLERLKALVEA